MLPVIAGVEGLVLTPRERELFSRLQPAGYILFTRNIADYEFTRELTDELRRLTTGPDEPIIAIDQEGGRVVRTAEIGVQLPSAAAVAQKGSSHHIR
jgi:beta-N-acetylhexosaminidase